ncbi:MAG: rhodanese-like domain-containing protein [Janthinobacterium lividum]
MKNISIMTLNIISLLSLVCFFEARATVSQNPIQDLVAAEKYFQEELEFTSNPYGVKMAIEGKKGKIRVIDVRSREAFAKGHIPGAVNIPYDDIDRLDDISNAEQKPIKDGHNYVYCYENLCNLSQQACVKLAHLGYPVKELKGGFTGWTDHKYPVEK